MTRRLCSIPGCTREHRARGWCKTHYNRWYERGTLELTRAATAREERETRFEDARDLMTWGTHPAVIAERVGAPSVAALIKQAERWDALDVATYLRRHTRTRDVGAAA